MKFFRLSPCLLSLFLLFTLNQASFAADPYQYALQWPAQWDFSLPKGTAMDGAGNVYVADTGNNRIQKFSPGGALITQWGPLAGGTGNGEFNLPEGVAVDGAGNVYVADTGNNRIQKFDRNGAYLTQWGSFGTNYTQFNTPRGISSDSSGNIFVADTKNHRILKFSSVGQPLAHWGTKGNGNTNLNSPNSVATDATGSNVYVSDYLNNRVMKFDGVGTPQNWGSSGSPALAFNAPYGIALDGLGNVYIVDSSTTTSCVQKYSTVGTYSTTWTPDGTSNLPNLLLGVAADVAGNVYVADSLNNRIQKLTVTGATVTFLAAWSSAAASAIGGPFYSPSGVAVNGAGNSVCVADSGNNRLQRFDGIGGFKYQWGTFGTANGQFDSPSGMAVDSAGNVYVADAGNNRIQLFTLSDAASTFVTAWGSGQFLYPSGVAADGAGNVFVADTNNNSIQKFTVSGTPPTATFVTEWGSLGTATGQFIVPNGVAADGAGNVYVADTGNNRIQKFTVSGATVTFVKEWGSSGTDDGLFNTPGGITVDAAGNVYVSDSNNNRIQKFDGNGVFLGTWGTIGAGNGQFTDPLGVTVDAAGNVFVADTGNNRIQKFTPSPRVGVTLLGAGAVASTPVGINCPSVACAAWFDPSQFPVSLAATPDPGKSFTAWGGACSACGSNPVCPISLLATATCTATFDVIPPAYHTLSVTIDGGTNGGGSVFSTSIVPPPPAPVPPDFACAKGACTASYLEGTAITLGRLADANSLFGGWTGSWCTGVTPCTLTMLGDRQVTAVFNFVKPVRVESGGVTFGNYDKLSDAYAVAPAGATIKARTYTFPENLTLDQSKAVSIQGGFDVNFTSPPTGYSLLKGLLLISKGTVTVERLTVE